METIILGIVLAAVQVAVTTIVGLIINSVWKKKHEERAELERLREGEHQRAETERCNIMKETIHAEIKDLEQKICLDMDDIDKDLDLMKKTMQKDVRRSLRQDGDFYRTRGWATDQEKTEFDELYWAYHNLGKNGVMDQLHEAVMHLDTKPKEK